MQVWTRTIPGWIAVLVLSASTWPVHADQIKSNDSQVTANDDGKVYIVSTGETGPVLRDIERVDFQGIACLRGQSVVKDNWTEATMVYIPIDKISVVYEYASLADYEKAMKDHEERKQERPDSYWQNIRDYHFRNAETPTQGKK